MPIRGNIVLILLGVCLVICRQPPHQPTAANGTVAKNRSVEEIRRAKSRSDFELVSRLVDIDRLLSRGIRLNYQRLRALHQQG
jgi:hypothetical protein